MLSVEKMGKLLVKTTDHQCSNFQKLHVQHIQVHIGHVSLNLHVKPPKTCVIK